METKALLILLIFGAVSGASGGLVIGYCLNRALNRLIDLAERREFEID